MEICISVYSCIYFKKVSLPLVPRVFSSSCISPVKRKHDVHVHVACFMYAVIFSVGFNRTLSHFAIIYAPTFSPPAKRTSTFSYTRICEQEEGIFGLH